MGTPHLLIFLIHSCCCFFFFIPESKRCPIKREWSTHYPLVSQQLFSNCFIPLLYHTKINGQDWTKRKEQTLFLSCHLLEPLPSVSHVADAGHVSITTSNHTSARLTAFLLTGVPGLEGSHIWISIPFGVMYLLAVIGNGLVMAVVVWDRSLHEPMYVFLAMLALNDALLCTVTVPKMLLIFWQGPSPLTFPACLAQMFFVHALFLSESAVLLAMAVDRCVAICAPLHYATLLTGSLISKVGLALVARSVAVVTPGVLLILRLRFCHSNIIRHTYCENMGIAKLACNDIAPNSIYGLTAALLTTGLDVVLISLSYWLILRTVFRLPSKEARTKALGTCGAHVCVILIFYSLAFFSFFTHRFGNHVPKHTLILLANLYLLVPPTMNPIVYGAKTKQMRMRVLGLCSRAE